MGKFLGIGMILGAEIEKEMMQHDNLLKEDVLMNFNLHYPKNLFEYEETEISFRVKIREDLIHPQLTNFLSEVYVYLYKGHVDYQNNEDKYIHHNMNTLDSMSLDKMIEVAKDKHYYDFQYLDKMGFIIKEDLKFYYQVDNLLIAMTPFKVYVDDNKDLSIFRWLLRDKFSTSPFANLLNITIAH